MTEIGYLKRENAQLAGRARRAAKGCGRLADDELYLMLASLERAAAAVQEMLEESQAEVMRLHRHERYRGAFRVAQHDLGMTSNYIRKLGEDGLFQLMDEKGWKWDDAEQVWVEMAAPYPGLDRDNGLAAPERPQEGPTDSNSEEPDQMTLKVKNESRKGSYFEIGWCEEHQRQGEI